PAIIIPSILLHYILHHPSPMKKEWNTSITRMQHDATKQARQQATLAAQAHVQATAGITSALGAGKVLYSNDMAATGYGWLNDGHQCFFTAAGYHVATLS